MQNDIYQLIKQTGRNVKLRRKGATEYTPGEGLSDPSLRDYTVKACVLNYDDKFINNTLIRQGDRKVVLTAKDLPVTPAEKDYILISNVVYNIIKVNPVFEMDGVVIAYILQVRI